MIYILIPTFNEEANIPNLFKELSAVLPGEDKFFVFCDDGSSDNTVNDLNDHFKNLNLKLLGDKINRGPGAAFDTGFKWILEHSKNENDLVVTMEADCTSDIGILPN